MKTKDEQFKECLEYEIYVPLGTTRGAQYSDHEIQVFKKRIVHFFGGLTDTKHRNEGVWRMAGTSVRDEIVVWKVVSEKGKKGDRFLAHLKKEMECALNQTEILMVRRQIQRF